MAPGIPSGAVSVSVAVLIYSVLCFMLSTSLTFLLISFGESWSYVTLLAGFNSLSTAASIAQQLHYATSWVIVKQAQYDKAILSLTQKGLAFGGAAHIVDKVLFFIQYYCYNVMALCVLFWTVALFTGSWGIRGKWLGDWHDRMPLISKLFAVLFPGLIVGLLNVPAIEAGAAVSIFVTYIALFTSLSIGSVLLVLILYKYMKTRQLLAGYGKRGRWWASRSSRDRSENRSAHDIGPRYTAESGAVPSATQSIYDRALMIRFTIGFVILSLFEIVIIIFTLFQSRSNDSVLASGKPDHSIRGTISDILFFIPGVTASLITFLVFGTTKSWHQYRDLVLGGCGIGKRIIIKRAERVGTAAATRNEGLEFERLPSLQKSPSEEEREMGEETANRVKIFVKETALRDDSSIEGEGSGTSRTNAEAELQASQFHRPMPSFSNGEQYSNKTGADTTSPIYKHTRQGTSNTVDAGLSFQNGDQVIQYDRPPSQQEGHIRQPSEPRRFVMEHLPHKQKDFLESDSSQSARLTEKKKKLGQI